MLRLFFVLQAIINYTCPVVLAVKHLKDFEEYFAHAFSEHSRLVVYYERVQSKGKSFYF